MPPRRPQRMQTAQRRGMLGPGRGAPAQRSRLAEEALRQRRLQIGRLEAMRARPKGVGSMQRDAYEQRRKSWAGVPIIGGLIELVRNLVYRQEAARSAKRVPHRQILSGLGARERGRVLVKLELDRYGYRPAQGRGATARRRRLPAQRRKTA